MSVRRSELSAEGWAIVRATIASWDRLPLSIGEALVAKAFRELEAKARCPPTGGIGSRGRVGRVRESDIKRLPPGRAETYRERVDLGLMSARTQPDGRSLPPL